MRERHPPLSPRGSAVSTMQPEFVITQPGFTGTVAELLHLLRTRRIGPAEIDLLALVRAYLEYFYAKSEGDLELATEALPRVAHIIEVKTRLLLPKPPALVDEEAELEEVLETVALLEELEAAILFLKQRREERRLILPARAPRPQYPRPKKPLNVSPMHLARLAGKYRAMNYFELAIERITLASTVKELLKRLRRGIRGTLFGVMDARTWPAQTMSFVAMLELVREGTVRATQERPHGDITIELAEEQVNAS